MDWLHEVYQKINVKLQKECERMGDKIPYIAYNGIYDADMKEVDLSWWCNGFWFGMLWQMYHAERKECFLEGAKKGEVFLDKALESFVGLHHDVGFMWLHTAVANYRQTRNEASRARGLHAATILAGRFNLAGGFISAWNQEKCNWMIIDSLMNIPLLYWASAELKDPRFAHIANQHANTALSTLLRPDGSCNHIAIYDDESGSFSEFPAGQGYACGSSWSRGQAWALYGFALAYEHTGDKRYLNASKQVAHYFIANVEATGYVSLVDFRAPSEPVMWDTTASACAASGLLLLSGMLPEHERTFYFNSGLRILQTLEKEHCSWDLNEDGILQNGTVDYHSEKDTHVPIIYGDYFFVEGILRLLKKDFLIW